MLRFIWPSRRLFRDEKPACPRRPEDCVCTADSPTCDVYTGAACRDGNSAMFIGSRL